MVGASKSLKKVLTGQPWLRRLDPYPHVVAEDVFVPEVADALTAQVRAIVEEGDDVTHFGWYDAWSWSFDDWG